MPLLTSLIVSFLKAFEFPLKGPDYLGILVTHDDTLLGIFFADSNNIPTMEELFSTMQNADYNGTFKGLCSWLEDFSFWESLLWAGH